MPRKKRTRKKKSRFKILKLNLLLWSEILIISLIIMSAYVLWLDKNIRETFEGKKWNVPARVFAQPLEIYAGLNISYGQFIGQLNALGYKKVLSVTGIGEYTTHKNHLVIYSRSFEFWDSVEPSRLIEIHFHHDQITMVRNKNNNSLISILRLEPELIGKIYPEHNEDRVIISADQIPAELVNILIAVEDRNFFSHYGIDPKAILRAAWINIRTGSLKQGGSTLTQQLVKNFFLSHERTYWRKFNELIMSFLLEYHYSKSEIFTAYINEIYLGQFGARAIHGFGTAAEFYFDRPLNELSIDQYAVLVALVRGASYYNPRKHPERARKRRNLVINLAFQEGKITELEAQNAVQRPLGITQKPGWSGAKYPAFMDLVKKQLLQDYDKKALRNEGLQIFTTLNPIYQDIAVSILQKKSSELEKTYSLPLNSIQGSVVMVERNTGDVLAMVGGRDQSESVFNRALNATRPVGSMVKPAVYLAALMQPEKYSLLTCLSDYKIRLEQKNGEYWIPHNYDGQVHGDVPLYLALVRSYNLATIHLGLSLGYTQVNQMLKQLGVDQPVNKYPSLFLGALNLTPFEVAQMYQTIANDGFRVPLKSIREVLTQEGSPLQRYALEIEQVIDPRYVYLLKYLMTKVVDIGTARSLKSSLAGNLPLAGKTGTTNDLRDSWFAGFGENLLSVVWLGRDDNKTVGLTGASGALQVWSEIMSRSGIMPLSMITPDGIGWTEHNQPGISKGKRPETIKIPYIQHFEPHYDPRCLN